MLLPLIDGLLGEAGIVLREASMRSSFGRGPGSFTGLRVAAAVAQGLAMRRPTWPLVPISSLAALAQGCVARGAASSEALVGVDARMGEIYWAAYTIRDGPSGARRRRACSARRVLCDRRIAGLGPRSGTPSRAIARRCAELVQSAARVGCTELRPVARDLLPLARRELAAGRTVEPRAALPVYLRDESAWERPRLELDVTKL